MGGIQFLTQHLGGYTKFDIEKVEFFHHPRVHIIIEHSLRGLSVNNSKMPKEGIMVFSISHANEMFIKLQKN